MKIKLLPVMLMAALPAFAPPIFKLADTDFLNTASQSNLAEIAAARVAVARTKNATVKTFASSMITDHTTAQNELQALAKKQGVDLASSPDTEHEHMVAQLGQLSGRTLDSAYMQGQLLDHEVAVKLFRQEASGGHDATARAYAAKYLPKLEHHLEMVKAKWGAHGMP
jgi:putative membrane protein